MGRPPSGNRNYQITHMWNLHHEIVRRSILGEKGKSIAKALDVSEVTVSTALNSKIVQDQMAIMRAQRDAETVDIAQQVKAVAPKAIKLMEDTIDDTEEPTLTRLKAAHDVLINALPKQGDLHLHKHYTKDELNAIKKRAKEVGAIVPNAEVEIVEDANEAM